MHLAGADGSYLSLNSRLSASTLARKLHTSTAPQGKFEVQSSESFGAKLRGHMVGISESHAHFRCD